MECARIESESTRFRNSKQWNSSNANIISCVISFIDSHITLNNWQHGIARVIINCHKRMYGQDMSADFWWGCRIFSGRQIKPRLLLWIIIILIRARFPSQCYYARRIPIHIAECPWKYSKMSVPHGTVERFWICKSHYIELLAPFKFRRMPSGIFLGGKKGFSHTTLDI